MQRRVFDKSPSGATASERATRIPSVPLTSPIPTSARHNNTILRIPSNRPNPRYLEQWLEIAIT